MNPLKRVVLRTPESVELEYTLADIGNRALALLIDVLVVSGVLLLGVIALVVAVVSLPDFQSWLLGTGALVFFFVYVGYFVGFESLWRGQTPGKRLLQLRVIREDGRPVGIAQATLRALLRVIDDAFYLGAYIIIFAPREKRLGDWAAGTLVVQEPKAGGEGQFVLSEAGEQLAEQLKVRLDTAKLLADDFAVVREFLRRRTRMEGRARLFKSRELAGQLIERFGLSELPGQAVSDTGTARELRSLKRLAEPVSPGSEPAEIFLEAVYSLYRSHRPSMSEGKQPADEQQQQQQ